MKSMKRTSDNNGANNMKITMTPVFDADGNLTEAGRAFALAHKEQRAHEEAEFARLDAEAAQ